MAGLIRCVATLVVALGVLAGCSDYETDIEKVKASWAKNMTYGNLVDEIADSRGSVEWSAERADAKDLAALEIRARGLSGEQAAWEGFFADENVVITVVANFHMADSSGESAEVWLIWHHNRANGAISPPSWVVGSGSGSLTEMVLEILGAEL